MEKVFRTTSNDKKGIMQRKLSALIPLATESGYHLDRYKTAVEAIKEWISNPYDLGEIEDGVAGGIQNASAIDETQDALNQKLTREILRYLQEEEQLDRTLFLAKRRPFEMGGEIYMQAPDAISIDSHNRTIETIRYKAGAATGMTRGVKGLKPEDFSKLEKFYDLYADLKYVTQNIKNITVQFCDGNPYVVKCNYYFLKKTTDKKNSFEKSFFTGKGNSIVGIEETHCYGEAPHVSDLDTLFAAYLEQATTVGFECDKNNCTFCDYKSFCNYTKANVKQEKKEIHVSALGTPSPAQQAIIDAACDTAHWPYIKVNAGAGSGKTYTMVSLVMNLLKRGYKISEIFVTSFTNAGVNEIRERIASAAKAEGFNLSPDEIHSFTFDSFYYQMISAHYRDLGFPAMPKLLKADVQKQYVEDLVKEYIVADIDYGRMDFNVETGTSNPWVVTAVSKAFNLIQTYHIDPDDGENAEEKLKNLLVDAKLFNSMSENSLADILTLYKKFDARLNEENLITYSHLQGIMDVLLMIKPDLYEQLGYRYIVVDEFQDSNEYQVQTIKALSETTSFEKMIVVGDDAQAIYGFRDTTPEYIIHFADYIGQPVKDMYLLENRRSTPQIINVANQVIALNKERIDKDLIPVRADGKPVSLQGFHSRKDERQFIVDEIERLITSGKYKPENICVIDRKRSGLLDIGTRLSEKGIPWVSKVGQNLLTNSKVKAALSLCDAFYDPDVTVHYFDYLVAKHDGQILDLPDEQLTEEIEKLKTIFSGMDQLEFEAQRAILHELLDDLKEVEEDEIYDYFLELLYDNEGLPEELEYSRIFKKYGSAMEKKLDQSYVGVTLVTAHSSKGLEWPVVFNSVTNYDTPSLHSKTPASQKNLEETRRLLFVSTTRARDLLYLTGVYVAAGSEKDGYTYNQFLEELHAITGKFYDPIDHVKEAERAAKREAAKLKRAERRAKQDVLVGNLSLL